MTKLFLYILCCWSVVASAQVTNSATPPPGTTQSQNTARMDGNYPVTYLGQYAGLYRFGYPLTTATNQFPFTITRSTFTVGKVINSFTDLVEDISQAQNPIVSISPTSVTRRLTAATTQSTTFTGTYSKQTGTPNFTGLQFTNSSGGGQTSGANPAGGSDTYNASYPTNTSTTITFTATAGSKSASASATVNYVNERFWGRSAGLVPTDAEILAASGGGIELNNARNGTFVIVASGTNYPFLAYRSAAGALTSIKDANGLEGLTSYTPTSRTLNNVDGASVTLRVYTQQNATAGNTTMVTQ